MFARFLPHRRTLTAALLGLGLALCAAAPADAASPDRPRPGSPRHHAKGAHGKMHRHGAQARKSVVRRSHQRHAIERKPNVARRDFAGMGSRHSPRGATASRGFSGNFSGGGFSGSRTSGFAPSRGPLTNPELTQLKREMAELRATVAQLAAAVKRDRR